MICIECGFDQTNKKKVTEAFGVLLCETHKSQIEEILIKMNQPNEVGEFYYGLKKIGLKPLKGWWNGKRIVPISLSRSRINIEFYNSNAIHNHKEALKRQEIESEDHQQHFICLQIPLEFLKSQLKETANLIYTLNEGLKNYS